MIERFKKHLSPFKIAMKLYTIMKLPAMTQFEIKLYKKALLSSKVTESLNIFEYGSGFSTIYFAKYLKRKKINFHIYTIDNNLVWHQKVKQMVKRERLNDVVTLYLSEFSPFWEKEGWDWKVLPKCGQFAPKKQPEFEYINAPLNLKKKFDFVSVDGRFRRRCLEIIPEILKENGIVFLHDAQKDKYHEPLFLYKYSIFIDSGKYYPFDNGNWKIWIGSLNNPIINLDFRYSEK